MKELLLNYVKMLRAGFFYKTFIYALLLISPSVVKAFATVQHNFYEIFFVILVGFLILPLGMNEISENRYLFCLTLPIRTKDILKIAYLHTYIIYILGFIGTIFVSIYGHQELPWLYLLFIVLYLLCTNLIYPTLASCELKLINNEQSYIWATILLVGMGFMALCSSVLNCDLLAIIIVMFLALFTLNKSYNLTLKKVMNCN